MRFGVGLAVLFALAAPSALAQQTAFVALPQTSETSITFWDMGGLRRAGADLEIRVLRAGAQPTTSDVPVRGSLEITRLSCDWNTLSMIETADVDAAGQVSDTKRYSNTHPSFYGPGGWHALVAPIACDPGADLPASSFTSLAAAMTEVAQVTKRPEPPPQNDNRILTTIAPVRARAYELVNFTPPKPSRYGVLRAEADTGNTFFIDWGNLIRDGDNIDLLTFEILGDNLPKADRERLDLMKLNSVNLHCRDRIITVLEYVPMDRHQNAGNKQYTRFPKRRPANSKIGAELLDAACSGVEPAETFATRDAAIAFQRRLHPLQQ